MKRTPPLGQHFLASPLIHAAIVRAGGLSGTETVLEIGPGRGALTQLLLKAALRVVAVERDPLLLTHLSEIFAEPIRTGALSLVHGDAREYDPRGWGIGGPYVVIANLPYYITGIFLRRMLTSERAPERAVLLIQRDVAERIVRRDGKESLLSIAVNAYATPSIIRHVLPGAFTPPPKVDSSVLLLEHISKDFFNDIDEARFFKILRAGFSHKRKTLFNNLSIHFPKQTLESTFDAISLSHTIRAEDMPLEKWKILVRALQRH